MFLDPEPLLRLAIRLPRLIPQFVHIAHRDANDRAPALLARYQAIDRMSPLLDRRSSKTPVSPTGVFFFTGTYRSPTARRAPTVRAAS